MRTRWICIGTLRADTQLLSDPYHRKGYWLNWRGRTDWCQPNEFVDMAGVEWAVRKRLRMVRLEAVAFVTQLPRREYNQLWVEVRRMKPRLPGAQNYYEFLSDMGADVLTVDPTRRPWASSAP